MPHYVLIVDPNREQLVTDRLTERGYPAYTPRLWRRQAVRGRVIETRRAMFAGYAFVDLSAGREDWPGVEATPGVWRFLTIEKKPAALPPEALAVIQAKELEQNRLYEARKGAVVPPGLEVGQPVAVLVGRFAEMVSRVERFDAKGRVEVLLSLLGRQNKVVVRGAKLAAA